MLRLFIRSCPRHNILSMQNEGAAQLSETIASDTIDSAVGYLSLRNQARPWCTYLVLLLLDISSRVAPIVKRQAENPTVPAFRVMWSMINAQDCLRGLARNKLSITHKALTRLNEISEGVNVAYTMATSIPMSLDADEGFFWDNDKPSTLAIDPPLQLMPMDDWVFDTSSAWHAGELANLLSSEEFPLDLG